MCYNKGSTKVRGDEGVSEYVTQEELSTALAREREATTAALTQVRHEFTSAGVQMRSQVDSALLSMLDAKEAMLRAARSFDDTSRAANLAVERLNARLDRALQERDERVARRNGQIAQLQTEHEQSMRDLTLLAAGYDGLREVVYGDTSHPGLSGLSVQIAQQDQYVREQLADIKHLLADHRMFIDRRRLIERGALTFGQVVWIPLAKGAQGLLRRLVGMTLAGMTVGLRWLLVVGGAALCGALFGLMVYAGIMWGG